MFCQVIKPQLRYGAHSRYLFEDHLMKKSLWHRILLEESNTNPLGSAVLTRVISLLIFAGMLAVLQQRQNWFNTGLSVKWVPVKTHFPFWICFDKRHASRAILVSLEGRVKIKDRLLWKHWRQGWPNASDWHFKKLSSHNFPKIISKKNWIHI